MESFKYSPLIYPHSEIRLVHLLPRQAPQGSQPQGIRCEIETVSLADCPEYTALSYAWGDPSRTSLLIIDDKISHITESVEAALLHLQHEADTIILWIDQLCINQDDDVEKSDQVQLMKTIYQGAKEVVAWLGPAADESDQLFDALSLVGKDAFELRFMQLDLSVQKPDPLNIDIHNRLVKRLGQGLTFPTENMRSLVNRPYWTRVWIVQELSLAQEVIFACGNKRISYDHLRHALTIYGNYIRSTVKDLRDRKSVRAIALDPEKLQRLKDFTSAPVFSASRKMLASRHKYLCSIENKGHDLYSLLKFCHVIYSSEIRLEATNHRDHIYGLLGLAKDAEELRIRPDYSESVSKVYIDTARTLIQSGRVDLLWLCQFPKTTDELPSWVPDWSAPLHISYGDEFSPHKSAFSASAKTSACVIGTDNMNMFITLRGAVVDEVGVIRSSWILPADRRLDEENTSQFLTEIDQLCSEALSLHNELFPTPQMILDEARWRTPIGDRESTDGYNQQRATSRSRKGYQDVLRRIEMCKVIPKLPQDQVGPFVEAFPLFSEEENSYRYFLRRTSNRRPFRSKKGYVGLGPIHMLPGDLVCIILGAQVPYVLRPCESHCYQLVG
jgi:hypothetical protein